eukprot:1370990-Lingulodinium_polyedra.AAC.1
MKDDGDLWMTATTKCGQTILIIGGRTMGDGGGMQNGDGKYSGNDNEMVLLVLENHGQCGWQYANESNM